MDTAGDEDRRDLLAHVLVPVATEEDARQTANALAAYEPERVTALHVVEKAGGAPDKTPVEQSEAVAERSFAAVRRTFPDVDDHITYARDVVGGILEAADEVEASAIAFRPRGGSRIVQFLAGDRSLELVTATDRPVIVLPEEDSDT